jgi:beta-lactamase regulating signal transducer with metallopeptidase domain
MQMSLLELYSTLDQWGFATSRFLLSALWQSSLLFCAVIAISWLLRHRRASARHWLWTLALLTAPLLPFITSGAGHIGAPQAPVSVLPNYVQPIHDTAPFSDAALEEAWIAPLPMSQAPPAAAVKALNYPWAIALLAYAIGVMVFLTWFTLGRLRIRHWIRSAVPTTDHRVLAAFRNAQSSLRLNRSCLVLEGSAVPVPVSVHVLHPRILLPVELAERLSDEELYAVALHETAHLRRRDPLILTLATLVRALLFFHPLVWLAVRQVSILAEHCADDAVLDATAEPLPYARMLTRLSEDLPTRSLSTEMATGLLFTKSTFLARIEAVLGNRARIMRLSRLALTGTVVGVFASLALAMALPLGERPSPAPKSQVMDLQKFRHSLHGNQAIDQDRGEVLKPKPNTTGLPKTAAPVSVPRRLPASPTSKREESTPIGHMYTYLEGDEESSVIEAAPFDVAVGQGPMAWQRTDKYVAPDYEGFFPDDPKGGKIIDTLFDFDAVDRDAFLEVVDRDSRSDEEILSSVRSGLRRTSRQRARILAWIGLVYIWNKQPQNPEAIEIMYHAIPRERSDALYYGLSVTHPKTPNILRTLADLCMDDKGINIGRIKWGVGEQAEELIAYLELYLQDEDGQRREKAGALIKHFRGEMDYGKWAAEQNLKKMRAEFSSQLPQIKEKMLNGDTQTRSVVIDQVKRDRLTLIMDDSFYEAWRACVLDPGLAYKRADIARTVGMAWAWEARPLAIEILLQLSHDNNRHVRYNAVYFGLSIARDKTEPIVRRLIEMALTDHESNLYGRITWGLSGASPELMEIILLEHIDAAGDDLHALASAYFLHKKVLKKEPPDSQRYKEVVARYPEDIYWVSFEAKAPFNPGSEQELWDEFIAALPEGVEVEPHQRPFGPKPSRKAGGKIALMAEFRGEDAKQALEKMKQQTTSIALGQIFSHPPYMQLFGEETAVK